MFDQSNYVLCRWRVPGNQQSDLLIDIFGGGFSCESRNPHKNFQLKCVESKGIVNSTLVILVSLQRNMTVRVECGESEIGKLIEISSINIFVAGE